MKPLILALITSSLCGCQTIQRPDTYLYGVNAKASKLRGYNLKTDYDANGNRLTNAKPHEIHLKGLIDLNGWTCTDPKGLEHLIVYKDELYQAYLDLKKTCN